MCMLPIIGRYVYVAYLAYLTASCLPHCLLLTSLPLAVIAATPIPKPLLGFHTIGMSLASMGLLCHEHTASMQLVCHEHTFPA